MNFQNTKDYAVKERMIFGGKYCSLNFYKKSDRIRGLLQPCLCVCVEKNLMYTLHLTKYRENTYFRFDPVGTFNVNTVLQRIIVSLKA